MMMHARPRPQPERLARRLRALEAGGRVRWCAPLARYEPAPAGADPDARADAETVASLATWLRRRGARAVPTPPRQVGGMGSRYRPLADYLASPPAETTRMTLTLQQIEVLLGGPLPPSAGGASWWANTPGPPQSRAWLAAGWHVAARSLRSQPPAITFARGPAVPHPPFTPEP